MKLRIKLTAMIVIMVIALAAALSLSLLARARSLQTQSAKTVLEYLSGMHAMNIRRRYETSYDAAFTLAQIMNDFEAVDRYARRDYYNQMMESLLESSPAFIAVYTVWRAGVLDGRDQEFAGAPGADEAGAFTSWYTREGGAIELRSYPDSKAVLATLEKVPVLNDPVMKTIDGKNVLLLDIRIPIIRDSDGAMLGVVGINYDLVHSREVVDAVRPYGTGWASLVAHDGTVVTYGADPTKIGRKFTEVFQSYLGPTGTALVADSLKTGHPISLTHNGEILQSYPFVVGDAASHWTILTAVHSGVVLEAVTIMERFTGIIAAAAVVIALVISFFVSGAISGPLSKVALTLKDISEGEGDLTRQIAVSYRDELGDLARYFNKTLEKLRGLIVTIKKQAAALFDIGSGLATNMAETAAAVNQIAANVQSVKARGQNQSASVTETNAAMEAITGNINRLNGHIEEQTTSVAQSSSAIEEMLANIQSVARICRQNAAHVKELSDASAVGREGLHEVAEDITEIARESEGLLEINAVMENIAAQTNLLSMNAAIEAAHAGESGKGFAVVAAEIRKLAESSGDQSRTISAVLKRIKDSIDKIKGSTGAVLDKFEAIDGGVRTVAEQEENIRTAMDEQNAGSQQILEAIGRLNEITQLVKGGSMEMLEGSKEVITEGRNLEMATEEISRGMNEMVIGTDQINAACNRINTISGDNKASIAILMQEVSRFKVD